jgi:hypothetical protein
MALRAPSVPMLLLNHGSAHNLLRDHRFDASCFKLVDDTGVDRGGAFLKAAEKETASIVVADELTCLDVVGAAAGNRPVALLNHRLTQQPSGDELRKGGPYFSVAVRSSAPEWVRFFEQAVPLSLLTYRDSIAESHAELYATLRRWTAERISSLGLLPAELAEARVADWCRSVLLMDRPLEISPEWRPVLRLARKLIDASSGRITRTRVQTPQE